MIRGAGEILGCPSVRDRVVQQALLNRLQRIFEPKFCDCSFGFRSGRSPHQAIARVEEYLKRGYQWVVEVDDLSPLIAPGQKLVPEV